MSEELKSKLDLAAERLSHTDPTTAELLLSCKKDLAELERLRKALPDIDFVTCAYCGFKLRKGQDKAMADHIFACDKNPLGIVVRERWSAFEAKATEMYANAFDSMEEVAELLLSGLRRAEAALPEGASKEATHACSEEAARKLAAMNASLDDAKPQP